MMASCDLGSWPKASTTHLRKSGEAPTNPPWTTVKASMAASVNLRVRIAGNISCRACQNALSEEASVSKVKVLRPKILTELIYPSRPRLGREILKGPSQIDSRRFTDDVANSMFIKQPTAR